MPTINTFKHETDVATFSTGQTIFQEGDPADVMYVVQEGEMGLIDSTARSGSAIAKTDCKLIPLDETRFKVYVHNTPFFAIQVMRVR